MQIEVPLSPTFYYNEVTILQLFRGQYYYSELSIYACKLYKSISALKTFNNDIYVVIVQWYVVDFNKIITNSRDFLKIFIVKHD